MIDIVIFIFVIALIVLLTAKYNVHAFITLVFVSIIFGIIYCLYTTYRLIPELIVASITLGFGKTVARIGIIVVIGTILSVILEKTGAATRIAIAVLKVVGRENLHIAMNLTGYITGIPIFCDSGFVILSPIARALSKLSKASAVAVALALASGLYTTHALVPPTPGPLIAAELLNANMAKVICLGLPVSLFSSLVGFWLSVKLAPRISIVEKSFPEELPDVEDLPPLIPSLLPLVTPIVLLILGTYSTVLPSSITNLGIALSFLGSPLIAFTLALIMTIPLIKNMSIAEINDMINRGIKIAAAIIVITGAGGALGNIMEDSGIGYMLGSRLASLGLTGPLSLLMLFAIAAVLKIAQGSTTVALVTTPAIVSSMIPLLHVKPFLAVLAIAAGSMVVSHVNDSYFWIVVGLTGMDVRSGYKSLTLITLVQGLVSIALIILMSEVLAY